MRAGAAKAASHTGAPRLTYLPGLDGLRALAVSAVLLYHADLAFIPGGYLGVEIFFVLSGYLITSLLLSEWRQSGKINLGYFWLRRARRLLPALFLLLASVSVYAVIFLPDEVARLRGDALSASGYVTNWYLAFSQQSYFEFVGRPSLLQHLWSLAVEEQFYLLWPILFVAGMMAVGAWRRHAPTMRRNMLILSLTGAGASAWLMSALYNPDADPSRIYYGTDTRAAALLIGCALAFAWSRIRTTDDGRRTTEADSPLSRIGAQARARMQSRWLDLAGLVALGALVVILLNLDESQPFLYQGGLVVTSLVTAALIAVVAHPNARMIPWLLGLRPLRWIGMRSYGIYLWHWPIFMVTRPQLDLTLDGAPLLVLRFGLTVALAEVSYRFVETPIREGSLGRYWRAWREARGVQRSRLGARFAIASMLSVMLAVVLGAAMVSARPPATPDYLLELEANATVLPEAVETSISVISPVVEDTATVESLQPSPTLDPTNTEQPPQATSTPSPTVVIPGLPICPTPVVETPVTGQSTQLPSVTVTTPTSTLTPTARPTSPSILTATKTITPKPPAQPTFTPAKLGPTAVPPKFHERVLAIGDSVMLSGAKELRKTIPNIEIDASVSRQLVAGIALLKARSNAGTLANIVVIHLGNNGTFSAKNFDQIMAILGSERRVIFINNKVPRSWERTNNAAIAAGVQRYPNTALLDWRAASNAHPELFAKDGIHLGPKGVRLYTDMLVELLRR